MEKYVAITGKSNEMYVLLIINEEGMKVIDKKIVRKDFIPQLIRGMRPINFSIRGNEICETMGGFNRMICKEGVQPHIVVQELATSIGTIVGYRLLSPITGSIMALKKEDIIARQAKSSVPILQNGIIRGNKVNCYPNSNFPRFIIGTKTRSAAKKVPVKDPRKQEGGKVDQDFFSLFTHEQKIELNKARENKVDWRLIANPKLSPEQMRVIWVAQKKGAYPEYYSSPEYSVDVMKFYADRLVTQKVVKECADLLAHKDYGVDKLTELYLAVCEGIDYSSFIECSSADEMRVKREELRGKLWSTEHKASIDEAEYINSGVRLAERLRKR